MLLTEIAVQNVTGFGPAARLALGRGLNAVVSPQGELVRLIRGLFYPGPDDAAVLCAGPVPRKAALTLHARDGTLWRLVRDFDGGRTLLRGDSAGGAPERVGDDPATVAALLRERAGLPPEEVLVGLLTLGASDLPSRVAQKAASQTHLRTPDQPDLPVFTADEARIRLPELRIELEQVHRQETAQEAMDDLQRRLEDLDRADEPLRALEHEISLLEARLSALPPPGGGAAALEARVRRFPDLLARRDAALEDLRVRRERLREQVGDAPGIAVLARDPMFSGGVAAGLALIALGFAVEAVWPWALNLVAFGVAAFAAWRWVDAGEEADAARRRIEDADEAERRIQKQFESDAAPVYAAMKAFGVAAAEDVLHRLEEREMLDARLTALVRELETRRAAPPQVERDQHRQSLQAEYARREEHLRAAGFGRDTLVVRREIQACEEALTGGGGRAGWDPSDSLSPMIARAAEIMRLQPLPFMEAARVRVGQYVGALTDGRFVGLRPGPAGSWYVMAASGASGPINGLPPADRDLVFIAVRLALFERVAVPLSLPMVCDDPSLLVDPPHRGLLVQMLRTIAAGTQVMVRAAVAPPPGMVDRVVQVGGGTDTRAA